MTFNKKKSYPHHSRLSAFQSEIVSYTFHLGAMPQALIYQPFRLYLNDIAIRDNRLIFLMTINDLFNDFSMTF